MDPYSIQAILGGVSVVGTIPALYLLDACEKVFANELDQATFEEHMRWFFRTQVRTYYWISSLYAVDNLDLPIRRITSSRWIR